MLTNTKLRPRQKETTVIPKTSGDTYVTKMEITIERNGIATKHPLFFDHDPIKVKEMYSQGFLGDIEFNHPEGVVEKAELEAGPVGEFDGDKVGKFVFKLTNPKTKEPLGAKVTKFNFYTR